MVSRKNTQLYDKKNDNKQRQGLRKLGSTLFSTDRKIYQCYFYFTK